MISLSEAVAEQNGLTSYVEFFGLQCDPFHVTPDPRFLFLSPSHKEAFAALRFGVERRKGLVVVTGEVGTGKTTILRTYLRSLQRAKAKVIYLFDPGLTFEDLLRRLLHEFGQEVPLNAPVQWMMQWLHHWLMKSYREGIAVILTIDEAQHIPLATLERLRVLTNLETGSNKLLQILIVGQPELEESLRHESLRELRQLIAIRAKIHPLTESECLAYLQHRIEKAGGRAEDAFTRSALKEIVKSSGGVPRTLNILASNALLSGTLEQRKPISLQTVRRTVAEFEGRPAPRPMLKWAAAAAILIISAVALLAAGLRSWT